MSEKLLPCPFCGGEPSVQPAGKVRRYQIYCAGEECFGPATTAGTETDAAVQWNTRHAHAPSRPEPMEWRCFHCGIVATTPQQALDHFGKTLNFEPACQGEGGQWAQRLRRHVRSFFNGLDTGAIKISTDQDETLERDLKFMRYAIDHYEAQKPTVPAPAAPPVQSAATTVEPPDDVRATRLASFIEDKIEVDVVIGDDTPIVVNSLALAEAIISAGFATPAHSTAMTDERVADRQEFMDAYKGHGFDFTEDKDAWGRPKFMHSHIEAMWDGFQKGRAAPHSPDTAWEALQKINSCLERVWSSDDRTVEVNGLVEMKGIVCAALSSAPVAGEWKDKVKEIVDLFFAPWGAAKGARWEAMSGDQPFNADVAMGLIEAAIVSRNDRGVEAS